MHPFDGPLVKSHYAPDQVLTPVHTDIRIKVDIAGKSLEGHVTHVVARHPTAPFNPNVRSGKTLTLNAVGLFNVQVLTDDNSVTFTYDGKFLTLTWKEAFKPAQERRVDIKYTVKNPISGLFFSHPDQDYPDLPTHAITDHETERCRYWLPCIDYPSIRATISFEITCKPEHIALANGKMINESLKDGWKVVQWKLEHPCPSYLICWAVGEFHQVNDVTVNEIPIAYFAPKCFQPSDIRRAFDKTPSMIKWLQEKVSSPFPWPKYYQIAAAEVGGAMENISLVTWNDRYIMDETWAKEMKLQMDLVNIHEMAHTYFGDLIVIRHFDQVWLKESWATYVESCWLEDHQGQEPFRYEMFLNAEQYIKETENYMRPIVNRLYYSSWSLFDSHTYPGGAWRIHMLRKLLGDDCFWTAVRQYVAAFRGSVVETEDFRKILESQSGLNLIQFFDQWYYSKGFPKFKATYEFDSEKKLVKVSLEQTQVDKEKTIPLFNVQVEVEIIDEQGKSFMDIIEFSGEQSKLFVTIPLESAKPKIVRIDPEGKILCQMDFNPGEEILLNNAKSAADVCTRIRAYRELVKIGSPASFEKVSQALKEEKFYGVRVQVAEALGDSKLKLAVDILIDMLLSESDPMALWQIARQCKIVDSKLRQALKNLLIKPGLPYRARQFALEALGFQNNPEDFEYLKSVASNEKMLGQHNFIRAGALRAISFHQSQEAFDYLYTQASQRNLQPFRLARPTAVECLARVTLWQSEKSFWRKTVSLLRQFVLRDPDLAVRKVSITGLVSLEAKAATDDITTSKALMAEQDWEWVDSQLKKLSLPSSIGELTKKFDALEGRLRSAEEKLLEKGK